MEGVTLTGNVSQIEVYCNQCGNVKVAHSGWRLHEGDTLNCDSCGAILAVVKK